MASISGLSDASPSTTATRTTFLGQWLGWLLITALLVILGTSFVPKGVRKMPDFEVYYRVGSRVLAAEPLYRAEDGHFQHKYLPVFGFVMAPFALLPLNAAKTIWFYGSIGALVGLLWTSATLLPRKRVSRLLLAFLALVAMAKFFEHELRLGQGNALMALIVLAALASLMNGRDTAAGALFALSAVVKPYALIFLPYLLLKRRLAPFGVFLVCLAALLLLPAAIYGAAGNIALLRDWIGTLIHSTPPNLFNNDNVSIWTMSVRWLGRNPLALVGALVAAALIVTVLVVAIRRGQDLAHGEYLEVALILAVIPLLSPQGWDYMLLMATPAIMLFANVFENVPAGVRWTSTAAIAVMALTIFFLIGREAYAAFMKSSALTVCALLALMPVVYVRLRRIA